MSKILRNNAIGNIRDWFLTKPFSKKELSRRTGIASNTISRYCDLFEAFEKRHAGRLRKCKDFRIFNPVRFRKKYSKDKPEYKELVACLPRILQEARTSLQQPVYQRYHELHPDGYQFEGFRKIYRDWRKQHHVQVYACIELVPITAADKKALKHWRLSNDHDKWKKATVILGAEAGMYLEQLVQKTDSCHSTIKGWIAAFNKEGISGLCRPPQQPESIQVAIQEKKDRLFALIHESPKLHQINRPVWRLEDLVIVYQRQYHQTISMATVALYLKQAGYRYKKARLALTSHDPEFREKLDRIKDILRNLQPDQKFFSFDELGPFAIRMKQGWAFLPQSEVRLVPQRGKSKGYLICMAALELSTNQVSHFYSKAKNSAEVIRLIDLLIEQYPNDKQLYLSGDAASWHSSTMVTKYIEQINKQAATGKNPSFELVLLPSSSQFLNIIESVFSGLCKAVIHNSDYESVEDCKIAIDRHFQNRNTHFQQHPRKAGHKIWGQEITKPEFDEANNCKEARAYTWSRK